MRGERKGDYRRRQKCERRRLERGKLSMGLRERVLHSARREGVKKRNGENRQSKKKTEREKKYGAGNAICGIGRVAGPSITRKYPRCWQNVASFRCVKPPARIRADPCISKNEKLSKSKKKMNVRCEWIFHEASIVVVPSSFPFAYKNTYPPSRFFGEAAGRDLAGTFRLRTKKIDSRSAKIQIGKVWKDVKRKIENMYVESLSSEPQPFDTAVNLQLL